MPDRPFSIVRDPQRRYVRLPDPELIAACLSGDAAAWDALIGRYKTLIYRLALRMGLAPADASDVLQEVSLLLVDNLSSLRDRSKLSHWLIITTKREVWRICRKQGRQIVPETITDEAASEPGTEPYWQEDDSQTPEEALLDLVDQSLVRQAVQNLPASCQDLLRLLYYNDPPCSHAETAKLLQMPLGSVAANRARCLQKLRTILAETGF